ncbi:bifunctional (p)ppGpp synthetase/guanosine-3',5'-bis(diphosphate) 3'-pyrophosphohydrolase [Patescibacteria group bacterium]|nr:MAG: bifunctional (p)ppGpp synthetase/guanosine-3',5'-bis(diphosphate) 3'-pyrophosphohydrolase [Patescibacteria group bacterium]
MFVTERLTDTGLVTLSYDIAVMAHDGQLYGGHPYIEHPLEVAYLAHGLGYLEALQAGCLLHDVVEDSDLTLGDLRREGVPRFVVDGVAAVTYDSTVDEMSKAAKARTHPIGHVIKFCDTSRNFASTVNDPRQHGEAKALAWASNYAEKLGELTPGLPSPKEIYDFISMQQ